MVASCACANNSSPSTISWSRSIKLNGQVNGTVQYLGKSGDKWLGVPACDRQPDQGALLAYRPDEEACRHRRAGNVSGRRPPKADNWTTDTFLKAAEACHKGGVPFGIGLGETTDIGRYRGRLFQAFGAQLVDGKGNLTVKTDAVRQALEFYKKLIAFLPPDVGAWDDASNNKWLVSGKGAMIMNPPSAWAVAKRDAPQVAEQCWTHGFPVGPKGRFAPFLPYFWSIWNFSKNKEAAKSLLVHLSQPASVEKLVAASGGYDLPAFEKLTTLKTWAEEGPPKGTLYHYPEPVQPSGAVDRGVARAAEDRPADLHAGHPDQDVPALPPGRSDGKDAGLGRRRV